MTFKTHTTDTVEINGKTYLTRHWYMDGRQTSTEYPEQDASAAHHRFYAQFVTPAVRRVVLGHFSKAQWEAMKDAYEAGDKHLNETTQLRQWDALESTIRTLVASTLTRCAYEEFTPGRVFWSLSDNTCITKAAARTIIEDMQNED